MSNPFNALSRGITNAIYLTPFWVRRFQSRHPDERVIVAGATKARKMKEADAPIRYEAGWVVSKRAVVMLTNKRIVCAGWDIPLSSITRAELQRFRSLWTKACVLKVSTATDNYQFGLQYDPKWEQQQALELPVEDTEIGYSLYSIITRVIAVAFLIWFVINRFF